MAKEINEITLKLKIDDKEYQATINVDKQKITELIKLVDPLEQKFENAYKKITAELAKYNQTNEMSVKQITEWMQTQNISLDVIDQTIARLQTETKALDMNTTNWQKSMIAVDNLRAAHSKIITTYNQTNTAQRQMSSGVSSMNMAIGQFGFLLGDADMFLMNFRMGMMSVANNFPMVIQFMQYAKQEAAGLNKTMGQAFFDSIKGPGGLLLGVNAAMLAMNILARVFESTTETISNQNEEIQKLADEYRDLSTIEQQSLKESMEWRKKYLEGANELLEPKLPKGPRGALGTLLATQNDDYEAYQKNKKEIEELTGNLNVLAQISGSSSDKLQNLLAGSWDFTSITSLTDAIAFLNKEIDFAGSDNERAPLTKMRDRLEDLLKAMRGGGNDVKKFAADLSKALNDVMMIQTEKEIKTELGSVDYSDLFGILEDALVDYDEILEGFRNVQNEKELNALNIAKEFLEKRINLTRDEIKLKKQITEDEKGIQNNITDYINKADADYLGKQQKADEYSKQWATKAIENPYEQMQAELNIEQEKEKQKAALLITDEEQLQEALFNIDVEYQQRRDMINAQSRENQIRMAADALNIIAGMVNENTVVGKSIAVAQAIINTYEGASKAIAQGGIFGPVLAGAVIAAGMANVANIIAVKTPKMKGYNEGGILPKGQMGFIEGENDELIAPKDNFISVVNDLVYKNQIAVNGSSYFNTGNNNSELINKIDTLNENIEKLANRPARAFIIQDDFDEGYNNADYNFRKGH